MKLTDPSFASLHVIILESWPESTPAMMTTGDAGACLCPYLALGFLFGTIALLRPGLRRASS